MDRHGFLAGLHDRLAPRSYLEIGINTGKGLARSRTRTIGVDPAYQIKAEVACDLQLVRATSDDFFARADAMAWFPEGVLDLAFVDGMHLFEFALRDFMNAERAAMPASVIVLDDMLPRSDAEAARNRHTMGWAGDVYKVALVLERYRPDLVVVPLDTTPTGLVLVAGLDPHSTLLTDHYDEILAEYATEDPQQVPQAVLHRTNAAEPQKVLDSPVWAALAAARAVAGAAVPVDLESLRTLRGSADFTLGARVERPYPRKRPAPPRRRAPAPAAPATSEAPSGFVRRLRLAIKRRL